MKSNTLSNTEAAETITNIMPQAVWDTHGFLISTIVFLGCAVLTVPLFKRLGLSSVLGYMFAGFLVGPWGMALVSDVESTLHFAELGVVLLLFVIGLELNPKRLWRIRYDVFGLGSAQMLITALCLTSACLLLHIPLMAASIIGISLALSSTAFGLQILEENKQLATSNGQSAFAVLLFQDLAVIPILAVLPLLSHDIQNAKPLDLGLMISTVGLIILAGHYLLTPVLRFIYDSKSHEVFTAFALLLVVSTALLTEYVGLSMALGSFLAGVLLSESEYRHQLEADIEPFKGLLMGMFFMAIGMSLDIKLLYMKSHLIIMLALGLVTIKFIILLGIGKLKKLSTQAATRFAVTLSQGGEFGFVIFGLATGLHLVESDTVSLLTIIITLSMIFTPFLHQLTEGLFLLTKSKKEADQEALQRIKEPSAIVIAGIGRFGQVICRILRIQNIPFTALDKSQENVQLIRKYGNKAYLGDSAKLELLKAARLDEAQIFVLAIDDIDASLQTACTVMQHFPEVKIYARAKNRLHAHQLMDVGVEHIIRETYESGLSVAEMLLIDAGMSDSHSIETIRLFRDYDKKTLQAQHKIYKDKDKLTEMNIQTVEELEALLSDAERKLP